MPYQGSSHPHGLSAEGFERVSEFFNAFNHPQFCDPDVLFNSQTFGQISCTSVAPRIFQFALIFNF
jgi:hypothetical protein